ncbi:MAG TPA: hypothetical protein VKM55_01745 [Candidatus Lokiarchaeia archaeon]|nr:hypothetical protein [Candidatus Lokiarchaeia archaeon]
MKKEHGGMHRFWAWWLEWLQGAGGFGFACSLFGILIIIILLFFLPFTMTSDLATVPANVATISYPLAAFGMTISSVGVTGGILGAAKEKKKVPGIAGIILGGVGIAILVGMIIFFQALWLYYNAIGTGSLGGPSSIS